jgi:alpha,alpha-trehalase
MPIKPELSKIKYIQLFGDLFNEVQSSGVFSDSKTFPDSVPKNSPLEIMEKYNLEKNNLNFSLKNFVYENFEVPDIKKYEAKLEDKNGQEMKQTIELIWDVLSRAEDQEPHANSTLINLPNKYVLPGGRFREMYYWDSYFTALGLTKTKPELIKDFCNNFCYLIDQIGFIPNGNRIYFSTRSHPPVFTLLVELLSQSNPECIEKYLPYCEKEYMYWMKGYDNFPETGTAIAKTVLLGEDQILNRYFDPTTSPREEAYKTEIKLGEGIREDLKTFFYQDMRAAAESGWDFSSRWFTDYKNIQTIRATEICPVDLNSLLFYSEKKLSQWYGQTGHPQLAELYSSLANKRKEIINIYCYSEKKGYYFDYCWTENSQTICWSLAGVFPLFTGLANEEQANKVAQNIKKNFLHQGGLTATTNQTGQQWDSPNGWAPLHWITIQGLKKYGHTELADEIKSRWLKTCTDKFDQTHHFFEKYNVVNPNQKAAEAEYKTQVGFGWTNGVIMALLEDN